MARICTDEIFGNDSAETPDNIYDFGSDMFVIRNGKIVAQTFAGKIIPKR
jgi:hypothetical protein